MRKGITIAALVAGITTAAVGAAVALGPGDGTASSHREAPLIADDPSADLTDVYAFRSPDKPNTVTILANVIPGEDPARGAELVHVLARRPLQPEDRHDRRREAGRDLPVPVPAQDRPVLPRRHRAAVHGDADPEGEVHGRRAWDDAAEQHRQALDPGLPEPRHEVDRLVRRRRLEGVRRSARRSVLRRHRRDLRPRRDPQGHGEHGRRQGLLRRLRRPHARRAGSDRRPRREERHDRRLGLRRPAKGHDPRCHDPRRRSVGAGQQARESPRQRGDHPDRA